MKVQNQKKNLAQLFKEKPILSWSELEAHYSRSTISGMTKNNELIRLAPGRYSLPSYSEKSEFASWALVANRSPRGVVCLLSALKFHNITLQNPHQLWWALPAGFHPPEWQYPVMRTVNLSSSSINEGVETVMIEDMPLRVFNITKTVADCFKFRNKIGTSVAVEALTEAWNKKRLDLNLLWKYAAINRVQRIMQPYLDTLK